MPNQPPLSVYPSPLIICSQDEFRLLKRKEQNRAAQRAFRERKEKHVKDVSLCFRINHFNKKVPSDRTNFSSRIKLPPSRPKTNKQNQKTRTFGTCCHGYKARTWPSSRPNSLSRCQRTARYTHRRTIHQHRLRIHQCTSRPVRVNPLRRSNHPSRHRLTSTLVL